MMHDVLMIDIHGAVDQSGLERLRSHLNLRKSGRVSDDWDQRFGYRRIERPSGQHTKVVLYRNFDSSWELHVTDTENLDPATGEMRALRDELVKGIEAAGYRATVKPKPTFGTAQ